MYLDSCPVLVAVVEYRSLSASVWLSRSTFATRTGGIAGRAWTIEEH